MEHGADVINLSLGTTSQSAAVKAANVDTKQYKPGLLDLWSITDFVQPGYLGNQEHFHETYDPKAGNESEEAVSVQRIARRRLKYETWWIVHLYIYLALALSFPHQIATGTSFVGRRTVTVSLTPGRWTYYTSLASARFLLVAA